MKFICFSVFIIVFISCSFNQDQKEYQDVLDFFDDSLVSHFPKHLSKSYNLEYDTIGYFNTYSISLAEDLDLELKRKILSEDELFTNNDSCIVVVNDFLDINNIINPETYLGKSKYLTSCEVIRILPNFWNNNYYDETTKTKLSNDFKFLILDSQRGIFNNKIKKDISFMPLEIEHGYSKGYAIDLSKNIILYWTIIW